MVENKKKLPSHQYKKHLFFAFLILFAFSAIFYAVKISLSPTLITNEKIDDTTPKTDVYFTHADPAVYHLARKIEKWQPVALEEVKALPEGTLNARYGAETTLLFHALTARNLQAIDVLLHADAAPYMIDSPKNDSARDFTYYLGTMDITKNYTINDEFKAQLIGAYLKNGGNPNLSDDYKLYNEFKTELIKIYLKNGGDPNHRLPGRAGSPFFYYVALMENYDGIWVLLKAGANPLLYDNSGSINPLVTIALNYDDESQKIINFVICQGYLDHSNTKTIDDIFMAISPGGPTNIKRETLYKKLAMRILKYHPDYPDNNYTQNIFNGPIPWKDILSMDDKDLCQ